MSETLGQRIKRLRLSLNEGQPVFGERFDVEQATVSRWENDVSPPAKRYWEAIAKVANMTVSEFFLGADQHLSVPIVGYVSGGESFVPSSDGEDAGGLDTLDLNISAVDQIAVRVRGDSMAPVYRDGDTIVAKRLGRRDLDTALGHDCIVMTSEGEGYVKRLMKGSRKGTFRLRSYNALYEDKEVRVEWAAPIILIRRSGP